MPVYDKPMIYYPLSTLMLAGIREILDHHHPARPGRLPRACSATAAQWGVSIALSRCSRIREGSPRPFTSARTSSPARPSALILGDNIFYGHGLAELLAAADARTDGRDGLRLSCLRSRSAMAWSRSTRRASAEIDRGEAGRAQIQLCGHRPLFLRRAGGGLRPRPEPVARAASWRSPISTGSIWRRATSTSRLMGARLRLARHRHACGPARCGPVREDRRGAAGPEDLLSGRNRLADGLHRRRGPDARRPSLCARAAMATICSACWRRRAAADAAWKGEEAFHARE